MGRTARQWNARLRRAVDAAREVAADRQRLANHLPEVDERVDVRALVVLPLDADLLDGDAASVGEREDLEVEGPAVDRRAREQVARGRGRERLETTLRVEHARDEPALDDLVA